MMRQLTDLFQNAFHSFEETLDYTSPGRSYEDEPIHLSPEHEKKLPPKEYRRMRDLALQSPFNRNNDAKIFYLQARYMELFEDDCPYDSEVLHYYPTYQSLSTAELRGYFTWRTRLRHGQLEKTSLSYAYLYIYELLHQIGAKDKENGFEKLTWFYEQYGALDPQIQRYTGQWIVDYAIYYNLPPERVRAYTNTDFDEAMDAMRHCDTVSDDVLFPAIMRLSSYRLDKSRAYKLHPAELAQVICEAYRILNARYAKRYQCPYTEKLYGHKVKTWYQPFRAAVFFDHVRRDHFEYWLSSVQCYRCEQNQWNVERAYLLPQRNQDLGVFVRAADRLVREAYDIRPALKAGNETKTMVRLIEDAIAEQKKAATPIIEFDLRQLNRIRKSSETIGNKLMTEEERYADGDETLTAAGEAPSSVDQKKIPVTDSAIPLSASSAGFTGSADSPCASTVSPAESTSGGCPLSGDELRFTQILLYGGDLQSFLSEKHLMASVLAEAVNEQLYDEFADTVIEFNENTPVIVDDYRNDLKGMIPS
ncbi:MAG: TerB N-terminal domain-containing protein [Clostridiales bacterium]|nr:TerB N-terminal domain-containing protein [Clostridiales bacterium]